MPVWSSHRQSSNCCCCLPCCVPWRPWYPPSPTRTSSYHSSLSLQSELGVEPADESRAYITFLVPKAGEHALPAFLHTLDERRQQVRGAGRHMGSRAAGQRELMHNVPASLPACVPSYSASSRCFLGT